MILLIHSSGVTNRINSGLPTEQGDTLSALFEESITGDGSATDPIVCWSLCIHAKREHKTSQLAGKTAASDLICAPHVVGVLQRHNNKDGSGKNLLFCPQYSF